MAASSSSDLHSRVELSIEISNLPRMDLLSKSDPFVVVSQKQQSNRTYYEIGRTETIDNNENPVFAKTIRMDYYFEELQELRFDVYDSDSNSMDVRDHDYIGSIEKPLSYFLAMNHRPLPLLNKMNQPIMVHGKPCHITLHVEEIKASTLRLALKLRGEKLDKKDWFGKSDGYLQFFRQRDVVSNRSATASSRSLTSSGGGAIEWNKVFETEVIKNSLDPSWKTFTINISELCAADFKKPILVRCWDWNSSGKSDLIGDFIFTLEELTGLPNAEQAIPYASLTKSASGVGRGVSGKRSYTLKLFDKKGKDAEKSHGTIHFDQVEWIMEPSFLDYIKGGMQINLIVGIDFTGSNGHPDDDSSLHYRKGNRPSPYQTAIETIGNIIAPYDSDQNFPVFGFGAVERGRGEVSHCFPLTFDPNNVEVRGVQGILSAYKNALNVIDFSGPTYFSPLLEACNHIASTASFDQNHQSYYILLLLTDGVINDVPQTIRSIVKGAKLPLSIVIVGVGNADFTAMKILDGDENPLVSENEKVQRDIVQFVPMRDFQNKPISALAKETLAEIPDQVLSYAKARGVSPMKPPPVPAYSAAPAAASAPPSYAPEYGVPSSSSMMDQPPAYSK